MKNNKGFTLTELMTVVLIIGTLAAIAYPLYSRSIVKARLADAIALVEIVRSAQQRNFIRTNPNKYFEKFTEAQITGDTRIIKGSGLSIKDGALRKGAYEVLIKNPVDMDKYGKNSCMRVTYYNLETGKSIFAIEALVEDSKMYCKDDNDNSDICSMISDREGRLCK